MVAGETGQILQLAYLTNDTVRDLSSNSGKMISSTMDSGNLKRKSKISF